MQWLRQPDVGARLAREAAASREPGYSIVPAMEAAAQDLQCTAQVHPEMTPQDYARVLLTSQPLPPARCTCCVLQPASRVLAGAAADSLPGTACSTLHAASCGCALLVLAQLRALRCHNCRSASPCCPQRL